MVLYWHVIRVAGRLAKGGYVLLLGLVPALAWLEKMSDCLLSSSDLIFSLLDRVIGNCTLSWKINAQWTKKRNWLQGTVSLAKIIFTQSRMWVVRGTIPALPRGLGQPTLHHWGEICENFLTLKAYFVLRYDLWCPALVKEVSTQVEIENLAYYHYHKAQHIKCLFILSFLKTLD